MIGRNRSLENSLRCMQHPLTLLSIALLLLNDHVFKVIAPSWLTGKLSDFAGLFFFPLLVVAALSLLPGSRRLSPNALGAVAFGLVGTWFFLFKTYPPMFATSTTAISALVGHRVALVQDWTDVLALIVLWPAWCLSRRPLATPSGQLAYIALAIGAIAAIATSPPAPTFGPVTDLAFKDGIVYAANREDSITDSYNLATSADGGQTWKWVDSASASSEIRTSLLREKDYPIHSCYTGLHCYRITSHHRIQYTFNNAETWADVFSPHDVSIRAFDLIIYTYEGNSYALIAIGENGVLRRKLPDGNWEIIPVLGTSEH